MAEQYQNFLTIDVEEWYHVNYPGVDTASLAGKPTNLDQLVDRLIGLCEHEKVKTTCFVLGVIARQKPDVVRKLHAAGHEIASHGDAHKSVRSMNPTEFRGDIANSCDALEQITGEKVLGFRAPSFSITEEMLPWYYGTLEERGLRYSSSIFPGRTFLYGIPDFPPRAHRPVIAGRQTSVLEIPMPKVRLLGKDMGLYLRFFPQSFIRNYIERENRSGSPVVLYLHPREIDERQPRIPLRFADSVVHYWGVKGCERKVRSILRNSRCEWRKLSDLLDPSALDAR
jgi:polysaccharide deacetylase family protein (PEP-CTERM system associated)